MSGVRAGMIPGCCVGVYLENFGNTQNGMGDRKAFSKQELLNDLAQIAKNYMQMGFYLDKLGTVNAWLTTEQVEGIEALKEIGFSVSDPFKKARHPESDLLVFTMAAPKFHKWGKDYKEPPQIGNFNFNSKPNNGRITAPPAPPPPVLQWDEDFEEEDM